ncbi:MAG: FG-GAP repeat protein, partial [Actinomycetes bacterium]
MTPISGGLVAPRRASAAGLVVPGLVLGLLVGASPGYAAPGDGTRSGCSARAGLLGSVDGDLVADVVVGLPHRHAEAGLLDVRASRAGDQRLTGSELDLGAPTAGDALGAAVAVGDVDGDGCADVLAGSPGYGRRGALHVAFGSPDGVATDGVVSLPYDGVAGDRFGATVALSRRGTGRPGEAGAVVHDLWVGAPGWDDGRTRDAGAVAHYVLRPGGEPRLRVVSATLVTQGTPRVPGFSEVDDRFGEVLAAGPGGVVVGQPHENVGPRVDAGTATWLAYDTASGDLTARSRSLDTPGVPGLAHRGDRMGAAVAVGPQGRAMVGVPGREVDRVHNAGAVARFDPTGGWRPGTASLVTQAMPGIPGRVERGDRFGSAVVLGRGLRCRGWVEAAVGAPGEDVHRRKDAGSVTVMPFRPDGNMACTATWRTQGDGLAGQVARGDAAGAS